MKKFFSVIFIIISISVSAQQHFRITRLKFNSPLYSEMAPVIYENGIVFSSNETNSMVSVELTDGSIPYNLYFVEKKGRNWGKPELFSKNIRSKLSESSASFSADFNRMFFTQKQNANLSPSQLQKLDTSATKNGIFLAAKSGKDWMVSEQFAHSNPEYKFAFPSISSDGSMLYFSSDMPGGYGGYDIYVSRWQGGRWQSPENMGPIINTPENEVFPFYHQNGRLYFSSRGHHDRQDLDIYYSEIIDGDWIRPIALPRPFNLNRRDEFGYVLSPQMDTGYFASNRRGTDDIYMFASSFPAFTECPNQFTEVFCYEFVENSATDIDTTMLKYEWDLGDGTKIRAFQAEHCYAQPGTYQVSLNVIDPLTGDIYFSEASYELLVEPVEQAFITAPDTAFVNDKVELGSNESIIRSFTPVNYWWDLGDGNLETGTEIDHTYSKPGKYYIRLGITSGEDDTESDEVDYSNRACSQREIIILKNTGD